MIYGIGTDLVEVPRIERILQKWGVKFTGRIFSKRETDYCQSKAFPAMHFAARFAVKESFLKCLGIGFGMGVKLKDIEVMNTPQGKPVIKINENMNDIITKYGINAIHISITHTREHALAVVVLEK